MFDDQIPVLDPTQDRQQEPADDAVGNERQPCRQPPEWALRPGAADDIRIGGDGLPHGRDRGREQEDPEPSRHASTRSHRSHVAIDGVGPGKFLVAWSRPAEQENFGIYFRSLAADGTLGPRRFVGSGDIEYFVEYVRLAAQSDGSAIVTWSNEIYHANARYTRWMSPSGEIRADISMAYLGDARVFSAPDDSWLMVWSHHPLARGRLYSPAGAAVGPDFDLPVGTTGELAPSIAFDAQSKPVLVGVDYGTPSGYDIFARRFLAAGISFDGFDSGDTSAWSLVEP